MPNNLALSKDCQKRVAEFQINCEELLGRVRNVVDAETYAMLSRAHAVSGNAAREIGLLIAEVEELRSKQPSE